jgi:hypothetical protein
MSTPALLHKRRPLRWQPLLRPLVSIDQLWVLVILAGFIFYVSLIPTPPNDLWWHLKAGELIFQQKAIPTTNLFAWTLPSSEPFFYAAWLGELLLYLLYRWGGIELIIFTRNLLALFTLGCWASKLSGAATPGASLPWQ